MLQIPKYIVLTLFVGLMSGASSSVFLYSLEYVTDLRSMSPYLIFGLPFFGFFLGFFINRLPPHINQGVPYILQEIDRPGKIVSILTAPFIFLSSLGTHLFGGSAGREGVGVLMGASLAHILPKTHSMFQNMRVHLIYAGVAAGFSSMFGTPLAGLIFSFEIHKFTQIRKIDLILTTLATSLIADRMTRYLGPNHHRYTTSFDWSWNLVPNVVLIGVICGLGALIFYSGMKYFTKLLSTTVPRLEWKLFVGGSLVCLTIFFTNSFDFAGIGTHMIEKSFVGPMEIRDFFMKCFLTIMTLSVGFKGGEVTPLFFMGATLSNSVMGLLNFKNYSLNSALGMVAIFGAVTQTPLASTIMACELFGYRVGILAFGVCFISRQLMTNKSIYRH